MSKLLKLGSHSAIYGIAPQIPKICNLLSLPFVTPYLTETDFGVFGLFISYTLIFDVLADLGFGVLFSNAYFKRHSIWKTVWRRYLGYLLCWTPALTTIKLCALWFFVFSTQAPQVFPLVAVFFVLQDLLYFGPNLLGPLYHRFAEKPHYLGLVTVVSGTVGVATTATLIIGFNAGFIGWIVAAFVTKSISFLFYVYPIYFRLNLLPRFQFSKTKLKQELGVTLPMIPHKGATYLLRSSDRVVMDQLEIDIKQVGGYSVAYQAGNAFHVLSTALGMVYAPILQKTYAHFRSDCETGHKHVRSLLFLVQASLLFGTLLVCIWIRELFPMLIRNPELSTWYPVSIAVILAAAHRPMYSAVTSLLFFTEQTSSLWKITLVGGILNVALNVIFVPTYGALAATVTTFLSLLFVGYSGFLLPEFKNNSKTNYYPWHWFSATIACLGLAYWIVEQPLLPKSICSLAIILLWAFSFMKLWNVAKQNPCL